MHPDNATLVAFSDGEIGADGNRRVSAHLANCHACRDRVSRIRDERAELGTGAAAPPPMDPQGLAKVLSAIAAWQGDQCTAAASELKSRLRWHIETWFGAPAVLTMDRPGIRALEMLGQANEMIEVFLGPDAAQATNDVVLHRLDWARPDGEPWR